MEPRFIIALAHRRYGSNPFGLSASERMQHLYIVGQTGTGKSTLLSHLARQDAALGQGFCLLDPHGDLAAELKETIGNCVYWDVADPACPYGYNPLSRVALPFRPLVASALIDTLRKQWIDAWGPRMEHLLRYAILALLDQPSADLRDILPLFFEKAFRQQVIANIKDEQVRQFWHLEYKALRYDRTLDGVSPIANKLGAFLSHPLVRQAVCAPKEPLRFRRVMDEGQCLIVNLATGRLGADTANVLGGLILSGMAHAAMSRADSPPNERRPFFLYADEFHAFTSTTLAAMLPQLRKYGVGLTLAHQYLEQLELPLRAAILGNVGNILVFRVGAADAPLLSEQLGIDNPADVLNLPNHQCFARMMVQNQQSQAFTAYTIAPSVAGSATTGVQTDNRADGTMG